MSDHERGTPEHTARMLADANYPSAYEWAMLREAQPEPYMRKQIENLEAMLRMAREHSTPEGTQGGNDD